MSGLMGGRRKQTTWQQLIKKHPGVPLRELSRIYHGSGLDLSDLQGAGRRRRRRTKKPSRRSRTRKGGCGQCGGDLLANNPYVDNYRDYYSANAMRGSGKDRPECVGVEYYVDSYFDKDKGTFVPAHWECDGVLKGKYKVHPLIQKELDKRYSRAKKDVQRNLDKAAKKAALEGYKMDNVRKLDSIKDYYDDIVDDNNYLNEFAPHIERKGM